MNNNIFGERLKKLRIDNEISQAKLATALKTYQQNIMRWEKGEIKPSADTIIQIAIYFHVTTDYLLGLSSSDCRGWIKLNDND